MSNSPIVVGFPWTLQVRFPVNYLQDVTAVRADGRYNFADNDVAVTFSCAVNGDDVFISLTEELTESLKPGKSIVTNLVLDRNGVETPIGQLLRIKVAEWPTRAKQ